MCVYTLDTVTTAAQEWRQEVAYRTIVLLRVTMDALYWSSTNKNLWETVRTEETSSMTRQGTKGLSSSSVPSSQHARRIRSYRHGTRTLIDEHFRAPHVLMYHLREIIMQHPRYLGYKLPVNEYRDLSGTVGAFNKSFHGFRNLVFTPYPFPLAQVSEQYFSNGSKERCLLNILAQ
jgi:hypothetical protein